MSMALCRQCGSSFTTMMHKGRAPMQRFVAREVARVFFPAAWIGLKLGALTGARTDHPWLFGLNQAASMRL